MKTTYKLGPILYVTVEPGGLTSNLKNFGEGKAYEAAIDGMEALLLAMATAGVLMDTPQMREAVLTAYDAITNRFED